MRKSAKSFNQVAAGVCAALTIAGSAILPAQADEAVANIIPTSEGIAVQVSGIAGTYQIFSSTDSRSWMSVGHAIIGQGETEAIFHDKHADSFEARYYRVGEAAPFNQTSTGNLPEVGIQTAKAMGYENGEIPAILFISRDGDLNNSLTVALTTEGSAEAGFDYNRLPGSVTIPAGQDHVKLYVYPKNDDVSEGSEKLNVGIEAGQHYSVTEASQASVWIVDNDYQFAQPENQENVESAGNEEEIVRTNRSVEVATSVSIEFSHEKIAEGSSEMVTLVISREGSNASELPVNLKVSGNAVAGKHVGNIPSSLRFSRNNNVLTIPVFIIDDVKVEVDRQLVVLLESGSGYEVSNPNGVQLIIADNDQPEVEPQPVLAVDAGSDAKAFTGEWIQLNGKVYHHGAEVEIAVETVETVEAGQGSEEVSQPVNEVTPVSHKVVVEAGAAASTKTNTWVQLHGEIKVNGGSVQITESNNNNTNTTAPAAPVAANNSTAPASTIATPVVKAGNNGNTKVGDWFQLNGQISIANS